MSITACGPGLMVGLKFQFMMFGNSGSFWIGICLGSIRKGLFLLRSLGKLDGSGLGGLDSSSQSGCLILGGFGLVGWSTNGLVGYQVLVVWVVLVE